MIKLCQIFKITKKMFVEFWENIKNVQNVIGKQSVIMRWQSTFLQEKVKYEKINFYKKNLLNYEKIFMIWW